MTSTSTNLPRGYGPRQTQLRNTTNTPPTSRFQRLCFDGNGENYDIWELKFLSYLLTKDAKLHEAVLPTTTKPDAVYNKAAFAELVQLLDDKSLQLVKTDAKDDANKALQLLRGQYKSSKMSRVVSLYTEFTSLRMDNDEDVTDYLIRADNAATDLKAAGETVSDNLVIAMTLKGLPSSYNTFVAVQTQIGKIKSLYDLKTSLITFTETNLALRSENDSVMKMSHKRVEKRFSNTHVQCLSCGKSNHKSRDCRIKSKLSCNFCHTKGHVESVCFKKKRSETGACTSTISQNNDTNYAFTMIDTATKAKVSRDQFLVDCGATRHILNDINAFTDFDTSFDPKSHFVELADGTRTNELLTAKGTAKMTLIDEQGVPHTVSLRNALCAPSFPTNLFSVTAATKCNAAVNFTKHSATLITPDGNKFPIVEENQLYYFKRISTHQAFKTLTLSEWHNALGHLNYDDIMKMPEITEGMRISDRKRPDCHTCAMNKQAHSPINKNATQATSKPLEKVYSDLCGPITPTSNGFRYTINFVDDFSGMIYVYFLKTKDAATDALERYLADTAPYGTVLHLHTDNGGEYISQRFKEVLIRHKIKHSTTAPFSPHQNGKAERNWRTIMEMARCLINESEVAKEYWTHAVRYASYLRNRAPQRRTGKTAFELFTKEKPKMQKINKFGIKCSIMNETHKTKLEPRSTLGIFLGINPLNDAYFVLDLNTRKINNSRNVRFLNSDTTDRQPQTEESEKSTPDESDEEHETHNLRRQQTIVNRPQRTRKSPDRFINQHYINETIAYTTRILNDIPETYEKAMISDESEEWKKAMDSEIASLEENNTWKVEQLPPGRKEIKGKWVFTTKCDENGKIEKYKARYVAKGCSQVPGLEFNETYCPTTRLTSIRLLLQTAIQKNMKVHQMDVKSAFLHAPIDTDIYLEMPEGYERFDDGRKLTCHLQKSIYGLKQSGRNWHELLTTYLNTLDFKQSENDPCLFIKSNNEKSFILIWVDDILIATNEEKNIDLIKRNLKDNFKMDDRGELNWFLGMKFTREDSTYKINQSAYIDKILHKFNMSECNSSPTPAIEGLQLQTLQDKATDFDYRGLVGSLLYLMLGTRPDIAWIVNRLSQHLNNPGQEHVNAAKHVLRYLKGTRDLGLGFTKFNIHTLTGYTDSDWASNTEDRKSTSGYLFKTTGPISWKTKRQPTVALSSTEAEYISLAEAIKEMIYLKRMIIDFDIQIEQTNIYCDNRGAIALSENPINHQRTKHIDIRYHFIRDYIKQNNCSLYHINSSDNLADALTKPLGKLKFKRFSDLIFKPD